MSKTRVLNLVLVFLLMVTLMPALRPVSVAAAPVPPVVPEQTRDQLPVRWVEESGAGQTASPYWMVLEGKPVLERMNAGELSSKAAQNAYLARLDAWQLSIARQAELRGAKVLARFSRLVNVMAVQATPQQVARLQEISGVLAIYPVQEAKLDLEDSVPWIGAESAQEDLGISGSGVTIGIIDSGIDYTHASFGGPGTVAAYTEATTGTNNTVITDTFGGMTFPTAKVIGGYDFVGSTWTSTVSIRVPDPDPLDDGTGGGHGSHVASIAAGLLVTDGITGTVLVHQGVAPGASLRAYKVCSSVSTSCDPVAMVAAIEQAAFTDTVDVINMSIGNNYGGGYEDYVTTVAVQNAVNAGVLWAVAAGNSENKPYIGGAPSVARGVLSTANSYANHHSAPMLQVTSPATMSKAYEGVYFTAAGFALPPTTTFTATLISVGEGCTVTPGLTGSIALIKRGTCNFSDKVRYAQLGGAAAAIIYNNTLNGLPYAGGFTAGSPTIVIPAIAIGSNDGNDLAAKSSSMTLTMVIDPANVLDLGDAVAGGSSRGPRIWDNAIKPDITAPGSDISAAGIGTGNRAVSKGGTSMASPHIAGVMALMHQVHPTWTVFNVYNAMMNTARITMTLQGMTGMRAPVALQGAGRVQVLSALNTKVLAWSEDPADDGKGSLSFGYRAVSNTLVLTKTVRVWNQDSVTHTYNLTYSTIYSDDLNHGMTVKFSTPQLVVPAGVSTTFDVGMWVEAAGLKPWTMNAGLNGGNGFLMGDLEFDGFVALNDIGDASKELHLPFLLIPHKAADVTATPGVLNAFSAYTSTLPLTLSNRAAYTGTADIYAWMGSDPVDVTNTTYSTLDVTDVGARAYDVTGLGTVLEFGIAARTPRAHPFAIRFYVRIDINNDGVVDYYLYNQESNPASITGQNIGVYCKVGGSCYATGFYNDTDLNTRNMRLLVRASSLGLTSTQALKFYVQGYDSFVNSVVLDTAPNTGWYTFDPACPRFDVDNAFVNIDTSEVIAVTAYKACEAASASQQGLLLLYRDQEASREVQSVPAYLPAVVMTSELPVLSDDPGKRVTHTVQITNISSLTDTFALATTGLWTATLPVTQVTLPAGGSISVTVVVSIPTTAVRGMGDVTMLSVTSSQEGSPVNRITLKSVAKGVTVYLPLIMRKS